MLPKPTKIVTTTLSREFYYGPVSAFIADLNAKGERASWQSLCLTAMQQFMAINERTNGEVAKQFSAEELEPFGMSEWRNPRKGRDPRATTQTTRVPSDVFQDLWKFGKWSMKDGTPWTLQHLSTAAVVWYLREHGVKV